MYLPLNWIFIYVGTVNLLAAGMTLWDKWMAKRKKRRIPESSLLWVAVLSGSPLMLLTMLLIRHKTRHPKFMVGLPVILLVQVGLVGLLWWAGCFPDLK